MSSPIHKFLFSPPPSPPSVASDIDPNRNLTSLSSLLLPTEFIPRSSLDGELKTRSPRTPQHRFTFDNPYPAYPRPTGLVEGTPRTPRSTLIPSTPTTPRWQSKEKIETPPYLPTNVPSSPLPIPSSLPKPLLRLLFLITLVTSSIMLLVYVPSARLPSLRAASIGRRLALAPDGRAYLDIENSVGSWSEARDRDYQPPQVRVGRIRRDMRIEERMAAAPPAATRPFSVSRPLPASHELLALQSYLLSSPYNALPSDIDGQEPLDAYSIIGVGAHSLGPNGGEKENAWLEELEAERENDIVIWYGGDGSVQPPHQLLDVLAALHGPSRKPTMIACHSRADLPVLHTIFDRLSLSLKHSPLVMIGNKAFSGNVDDFEELRMSGKLEEMMKSIGWAKREQKQARALKYNKWIKKEVTEVEQALKRD